MQKIIKTLTFKDMTDGKGETELYITDYMASPYVDLMPYANDDLPDVQLMPKITPLENQNGTIKEAYSLEDLTVWAKKQNRGKLDSFGSWNMDHQKEAANRYADFMVDTLYPNLASDEMLKELKQHIKKHGICKENWGFDFVPLSGFKDEVQQNKRLCTKQEQIINHNKLINTVIRHC